jgi:hypothetical protein
MGVGLSGLRLIGFLGSSSQEQLGKAATLPISSAGSERLPVIPLDAVQHLLRLREKLVERFSRSSNVAEHRLATPPIYES